MRLFYAEQIVSNQAILSQEETKHCVKILRKKLGDKILIIDGKGGFFEGELIEVQKKNAIIKLGQALENQQKWDFQLHVAIAPTKSIDRFEFFLEKATELGVNTITPILCKRSERKHIRLDRLNKIIVSAAKQSVKPLFPALNPLIKLNNFLDSTSAKNAQKFIAYCEDRPPKELAECYQANKDVYMLIGPEGDFHPEELEQAQRFGFEPVSLGKSRLRTETAGMVATHTIHLVNSLAT
ncbi:MAG: 16S rRNA (uracil(1498)-N(3))-methyltransferase [Saprospiraceae bacterium]|nr:16S rRNA (uracil(1498)-N(3))-methyltransferase [Saprospiraceae bacterium]